MQRVFPEYSSLAELRDENLMADSDGAEDVCMGI
jgi:hypothetical protein